MNNPELIVAIPSYMEADSIGYVVRQADRGITKYYKDLNSVIVNIDNNSEDNTRNAFLNTNTVTEKKYITTPKGVKGKGNNFYNLFKFANKYISTIKAVVVVDADLKSITPEWIKYLANPIIKKNYEYVVPRYSRHQFDGTITNHICYPLLYGLLGEDIRQPIGGEFAFSPEFVEYCLKEKWSSTTKQYGIDIFMTFSAIKGKFRICEAGLGAKIHKASAPKLGPMFTQVVTTLFDKLLSIKKDWINLPLSRPKHKPLFGLKKFDPPQELKIDIRQLKQQLRDEYIQGKKLLNHYLNDYSITVLEKMFDTDYYMMDTLMWTQVLYQLLYSYDKGTNKIRKEIIEALKSIYFTRSVTFDYQAWRYNINYAEEVILEQAKAFASQRPYLIGLYSMDGKKGR